MNIMSQYHMPALTTDEIREIGELAVAHVASLKITTTKMDDFLLSEVNRRETEDAFKKCGITAAEGRKIFNEVFNSVRKGE
ncbi:MAG TPA: hypothetical protein DCE46_06360 [Pantoea sp.]|nr:hypothetical protein [Pantoea sp.]